MPPDLRPRCGEHFFTDDGDLLECVRLLDPQPDGRKHRGLHWDQSGPNKEVRFGTGTWGQSWPNRTRKSKTK